jgi:hypothetical protein
MLAIAAALDDQHVAGPHQVHRVVQQRRIRTRDREGYRRSGDAPVGQQGADVRIHEAVVAIVPDGRGFDARKPFDQASIDRRRHGVDGEPSDHVPPRVLMTAART